MSRASVSHVLRVFDAIGGDRLFPGFGLAPKLGSDIVVADLGRVLREPLGDPAWPGLVLLVALVDGRHRNPADDPTAAPQPEVCGEANIEGLFAMVMTP